jgi:hypothetical protein
MMTNDVERLGLTERRAAYDPEAAQSPLPVLERGVSRDRHN